MTLVFTIPNPHFLNGDSGDPPWGKCLLQGFQKSTSNTTDMAIHNVIFELLEGNKKVLMLSHKRHSILFLQMEDDHSIWSPGGGPKSEICANISLCQFQ